MALRTLHELMLEQLRDVYSAEKQIVKALPGMITRACDDELRGALQEHLTVTEGQVERLDIVFEELAQSSRGKKCRGMAGLLEEGKEVLEEEGEDTVIDAAIIAAARRVEHYEIAAYDTLIGFAQQMEHTRVVELLQQSLAEEKAADATLTAICEASMERMPPMEGVEQR
ncbi:MAG: DUF892 family protein [Gemmatimonadaceae bacterium]